jgi:serine/threonine protein kinase
MAACPDLNQQPNVGERIYGKVGYRAPEAVKWNKFSDKGDIWSMGCIIYEALTRKSLFQTDFETCQFSEWNSSCLSVYDFHGINSGETESAIRAQSEFSELLGRILQYSPVDRIEALEIKLYSERVYRYWGPLMSK